MVYRKPLPGGGMPQSNHTRAGSGLSTNQARSRFGGQADVGAAGERYFGQIVKREALDQVYDVFYSLSIPKSRHSSKALASDVDAALLNGNRLVLVDVKRWKGNGVYWSMSGLPFMGFSPLMHGGKWKMSANMAAAVRCYREALPGVQISAMVVFVPTQRGNVPASVRWLKWPGGIGSFLLPAAVRELRTRLGSERKPPAAHTFGTLSALQR